MIKGRPRQNQQRGAGIAEAQRHCIPSPTSGLPSQGVADSLRLASQREATGHTKAAGSESSSKPKDNLHNRGILFADDTL